MRELDIAEVSVVAGGDGEPQPHTTYNNTYLADGPFDGGTTGSGGTIQPGTDPAGHRNQN
ncbi:hypothetical protein [Lysobacter sp. HA18]